MNNMTTTTTATATIRKAKEVINESQQQQTQQGGAVIIRPTNIVNNRFMLKGAVLPTSSFIVAGVRLFTIAQVAKWYHVSTVTLYTRCKEGLLNFVPRPFCKKGKLITEEELYRIMKEGFGSIEVAE